MCAPQPDKSSTQGVPGRARTSAARSSGPRLAALLALVGAALLASRHLARPPEQPAAASGRNIVYVDVEGWYIRTPLEVAAITPFDLSLEGLPAGLPLTLGKWRGEDRASDPAIDKWLSQPEVAVRRTYVRDGGQVVWLSIFGSRGGKSFHLFEHTPETCYPIAGWKIEANERSEIAMDPRPFPVNVGLARRQSERLVFMFFYVWDSPARDPDHGVLSVRLAAPVTDTAEATRALLAEEFVPELFPSTLSWRRF